MSKNHYAALICSLAAVISTPAQSVDSEAVDTFASRYGVTVFVAEIEHVAPARQSAITESGIHMTEAALRLRIPRVFSPVDNSLLPGEIEATIVQDPRRRFQSQWFWTGKKLQEGQTYLILSASRGSFRQVFEAPDYVQLVTDADAALDDMAIILDALHRKPWEQAEAVSSAVLKGGKPRSLLLADYAAELLARRPDSETDRLLQALSDAPASAFSKGARAHLLDSVARSEDEGPQNRMNAFAMLTAKYFAEPLDPGVPALSGIRLMILDNCVGLIAKSPKIKGAMPRSVRPGALERLRSVSFELLDDPKTAAHYRERIQELLAILDQKQ